MQLDVMQGAWVSYMLLDAGCCSMRVVVFYRRNEPGLADAGAS
jgi:hypothetical protein